MDRAIINILTKLFTEVSLKITIFMAITITNFLEFQNMKVNSRSANTMDMEFLKVKKLDMKVTLKITN